MHMHCHLKQVVDDYGPMFGFWLFSFEIYNGVLECQLLKRFVRDNYVYSYEFPQQFQEDFKTVVLLMC